MVLIDDMTQFFPPYDEDVLKTTQEVPLFPLSKVVLLPGEPLPLHIFEERYRIMTESAISSERLIAMAHLKPGLDKGLENRDGIYDVCGLGRIVLEEKLADGKYNLVLVGLKRIKINRIVQEKPYMRAEVEILPDQFSQTSGHLISSLSSEINDYGLKLMSLRKKKLLDDAPSQIFDNLKTENLPLSSLCDLFAAALSLPASEKQMIMEEIDVIRRAKTLLFALRYEIQSFTYGSHALNLLH